MDTVLTLACNLWFKVRILTLSSLLFVRSCLRDDHDMGAQLVPVLVVVAAATGAAGTVAVLVCVESFLTVLSFTGSTMQVMYCIASFPNTTSTCGPGQHDAADNM